MLVVAPHPDDEVLGAAGLIRAVTESGGVVRIVLVTAGDGYRRAAARLAGRRPAPEDYLELGRRRYLESVRAAGILGAGERDVICLGYPDGGLAELERTLSIPETHGALRARTGAVAVPYGFAWRPGAPYLARDLLEDLATVMSDFAPTAIVAPDPRETNADHRAAATFAALAAGLSGSTGLALTFLVHYGHYPMPWAYLPDARMSPPRALRRARGTWRSFELDPAHRDSKLEAIGAFTTQNAVPDLGYYMRAFVRRNELFFEGPAPA